MIVDVVFHGGMGGWRCRGFWLMLGEGGLMKKAGKEFNVRDCISLWMCECAWLCVHKFVDV